MKETLSLAEKSLLTLEEATEYFNIAGQRVGNQAKGVVIIKQRLANGQVVTKKVMK